DLTTAASSGLCRVERSQDFELTDRVDTRICLDREIRSAVSNIGTIDGEGILTRASSVDRDLNGVRLALRISRTDINLIGKIVRNAGGEREKLYEVTIVDRKFACLVAVDRRRDRRS